MTTKTIKVKNTDDLVLALGAGYEASQIEIDHTEAVNAAVAAAGAKQDLTAVRAEGATAERTRIAALHEMVQPGFSAELATAIESGSSPEAFAMAMFKAAKDRGITLGAIHKDAPKAAPHAKPGDDQPPPVGTGASWDRFNTPAPQRM